MESIPGDANYPWCKPPTNVSLVTLLREVNVSLVTLLREVNVSLVTLLREVNRC